MAYLGNAVEFLGRLVLDWIGILFFVGLALYRARLPLMSNPVYRVLLRFISYAVRLVPRSVGRERERIALLSGLLLSQYLKVVLLTVLGVIPLLRVAGVLLLGLAFVLHLAIQVYLFSILIMVVLSWLAPSRQVGASPVVDVLLFLTEPVLRPLRRRLPVMGGFDVSPIVAMVLLYLLLLLVYAPLLDFAGGLR